MNTWGNNIRLAIFGESHGPAVGIVIDGLPAGMSFDMENLSIFMARRRPGQNLFSSSRRESDQAEIISGLLDGRTTGAPLCCLIKNHDAHSEDYGPCLRPGHADWPAWLKFGGLADLRGGGHFSGRLTAPLVFAGGIAKQVLAERGIHVFGRIAAIGGIEDKPQLSAEEFTGLAGAAFPVFDRKAAKQMQEAILAVQAEGDSLGGIGEVLALGVPAGLGEPFFGSAESLISSLLFSIPAVKGVEFGAGFALAAWHGSAANDPLFLENGEIRSKSNHNGGILGGLTTGMPLLVRAAIKPTPSISKEQHTVNPLAMKESTLNIVGRHDPCIVPRALPALEAALALCLLELCSNGYGQV